ncbi:PAS domain S-box protein [Nostoc sp. FACHB-110]|uniref:PAS domain S-box protein n=1 Tax=Nostoc sp. FACHB-110 TaxID=2692834 RepID=UPI00168257B6|nr:PAS domain S-box protein [Nostoc sp. FACHB-110]
MHVISDLLIAIAYFSIPVILIYFVRKRRDVPFDWIFLMFGAFIIACGTTHVMEVITLWHPIYWLSGLLKAITAFVSVTTAIQLFPLLPQLLALPSPAQLEAEIAERKRTEEILRENEQRWQLALNGNNDGIWDWNVKTNEVFFSTRWKTMLGYEEHEVANQLQEIWLKIHPEDIDFVIKTVQNHFAKITPFYTAEFRVLCKDGTYKWILDRGQALWDEDGKVVRMVGSHTDITERKQAEVTISKLLTQLEIKVEERTAELKRINTSLQTEIQKRQETETALRESEERFRTAFHQAAVGIAHIGLDGKWLLVNQRLCDIVGYTPQELQSRTFQEITHPDDLEAALKYVEQMLIGEIQTYTMEKRYFCKDGSLVWINLTVSLTHTDFGSPKYFIAVVEDISDRKHSQKQIQASLLEKEVLLKEIYHRVKNNLQVISSLLNLQSEYIKDKHDMEIFQQSQQRIASMALIHEKMYQSPDLARIDFGEYIQDLVASLFSSYEIQAGNISLKLNLDTHVLLGLDLAIPCGLIIHELISNSLKYGFPQGGEGEIHIDIRKNHQQQCIITVRDNGVGLPANFNFKNTPSLGLQLVNALTCQLAGDIQIKNNNGVEFQIIFPFI